MRSAFLFFSLLIFWQIGEYYLYGDDMRINSVSVYLRNRNIPNEQAVLAIIGEAEGEGYEGMLAVACAIRNRHNLKGVYGLTSPRVVHHLFSKDIFKTAVVTWNDSGDPKTCSFMKRADSWYSWKDFKRKGVPENKRIVKINDHDLIYHNMIFFEPNTDWRQ